MKTTNLALINTINILNNFSDKKLPQKISYAITKNLIVLQNDYNCYSKLLTKLFNEYSSYFIRDENDNIIYNENGVPIIDDSEKSKEFNEEIDSLLNIKVTIDLYYIPENSFDYEDSSNRYTPLSAKDIITLQSILCKHNIDNDYGEDNHEIKNDNT